MSGYLSNKRPASSTDWGVGNNSFDARFIEPTSLKKQTGYNDGETPTAVAFNWLLNNFHRWIKNLDERTPKVAPYTWTVSNAVSRPTDRDFATLAEALASPNVTNGDTLFVVSQETLTETVTISKSVKLVFSKDAYIYGQFADPDVQIVLNAAHIIIEGGRFYSFGGTTFELTSLAESCSLEGCFFNTEDPINDDAVGPGYVPTVRGCYNYIF